MGDGAHTDSVSIVRENLMRWRDYAPYCGGSSCWYGMPRTSYRNGQFQCRCGWRSAFDAKFIAAYEAKWAATSTLPAEASDGIAAARPLGIGQRDEGGCRDA